MKITLLHPSRGRADKALETFTYWIKRALFPENIEHIICVDRDEPQMELYHKLFFSRSVFIISNSDNVVAATNRAAKLATGDILIYLSDDFKCPNNWDRLLIEEMKKNDSQKVLLKVDDCLQKFKVAVLTIPIMTLALYKTLGYFWHPAYRSMFVDEDLYWTCQKNGWLFMAPELKFPHEHPANGKAPDDETYKRSAANWDQGKAVFAERKEKNFPLFSEMELIVPGV